VTIKGPEERNRGGTGAGPLFTMKKAGIICLWRVVVLPACTEGGRAAQRDRRANLVCEGGNNWVALKSLIPPGQKDHGSRRKELFLGSLKNGSLDK